MKIEELRLAKVKDLLSKMPKEVQEKLRKGEITVKAAVEAVLGKTPEEESKADPQWRFLHMLYKFSVLTTSIRDAGGIKRLTRKWTDNGRAKYAAELRRIVGELSKWIEALEAR